MSETRTQFYNRRSPDLNRKTKAQLCTLYRSMGGMGGVHPPEKWRKDEVLSSIIDIEWISLPEEAKLPDPPLMQPPCDECGEGMNYPQHRHGGDHHYTTGRNPDAKWIPADPPKETQ